MDGSGCTRRAVLRAGLTTSLLLAAPGTVLTGCAATGPRGSPFTLGVASGEPSADGVVLWTRLAPDPLAEDGLGGLGERRTEVEWELADDEGFRRVVGRGRASTGPEVGHSVHAELTGLAPGREYFYRFRAGTHLSPVGRTRTAPAGTAMAPLNLCFTSCARYEQGWFTAYARLAQDEPELVVHLGDYLYEYGVGQDALPGGNPRAVDGPETVTLANYRQRYARYRTDPDLQAAHAVAPWLVVFDDHEVEDDWAGAVRQPPVDPPGSLLPRRAAAFRAYWENLPLRRAQRPTGADMQLYRRTRWGTTATVHLLDTRQYRSDQVCDDRDDGACAARTDPSRTMTGRTQEQWLAAGLRRSGARWDLLAQQVFFSRLDFLPGAARGFSTDAWDGYPASRDRVVDAWVDARVRNPVVLTGDIHAHWAGDIRRRADDPAAPVVGTELVSSSITTGGDGSELGAQAPAILAENPDLRFHSNRRGYVRTRITADELTAEFRVVPYVQRPGAPVQTRARFTVQDRIPGLQPD